MGSLVRFILVAHFSIKTVSLICLVVSILPDQDLLQCFLWSSNALWFESETPFEGSFWSEDLGTRDVQQAMTRARFAEIWSTLRIYDGVSFPEDPRKLVKPLLDEMSKNFQDNLIMGKDKSIDEIMIGYFGKKCTQTFFIPRKPSKQKME